jgi:energy-coupling factor transport system ATP-binding protein
VLAVEALGHDYVLPDGAVVSALQGVSARFQPGEFVVVFGHNGSGKSTLARHLNGLLLPTVGRVLADGMDTRDAEAVWEIRRRVGMVFQNPDNQMIATLVEDDVAFGVENLGLPPQEIQRRVDEALELLGIAELRAVEPHFLSGGEKQLVAIAGVLAMRPRYLVLDEPSALLAPQDRRLVLEAVEGVRRDEGIGVVLITHHMEEAVRADRILVLHRGEIVLQGPPRAVFSQVEELERLSLDVPEATRIAHELRTRHGIDLGRTVLTIDELLQGLAAQTATVA